MTSSEFGVNPEPYVATGTANPCNERLDYFCEHLREVGLRIDVTLSARCIKRTIRFEGLECPTFRSCSEFCC